jgi:DNA-binding MarR family transcriptional regulator
MDKSLTQEFLEVMNNMRKLTSKHHNLYPLHPGEFMMLSVIHNFMKEGGKDHQNYPGVKVGELSEVVHTTKSATSKMLRSVEEKGYIERVFDKNDRRVVYVKLSEKGDKLVKDTLNTKREFAERTIQMLGEEDSKDLIRIMKKFYFAMEEVIAEKDIFDGKESFEGEKTFDGKESFEGKKTFDGKDSFDGKNSFDEKERVKEIHHKKHGQKGVNNA